MTLRNIFTKKENTREDSGQGISLSLSLPLALALGLLLICAVGWAFYLGWMVGKGENPEQRLAAVTKLITKENPQETNEANPSPGQTAEPEVPAASAPPTPVAPAAQASANTYPFNRPQGEQKAAWSETPPKAAQPGKAAAKSAEAVKNIQKPVKVANTAKATQKPVIKGGTYNYSFQLAAFKSLRDAENLKAKLQRSGVKSDVRKSGKVQLVVTNIRGNEDTIANLQRKLADLKLGKPLLLSKKEVPAKKSGKGGK